MDKEQEAMERLTGDMKHYCPDWDYMAIDSMCIEFWEGCTCSFPQIEPRPATGDFSVPTETVERSEEHTEEV